MSACATGAINVHEYPRTPFRLVVEQRATRPGCWNIQHCTVERWRADFGFYSGCVWGDDTSWKLRFLDFRELEQGRFYAGEGPLGYFPLPGNLDVKKAVSDFWVEGDQSGFVQFHAAKSHCYRREQDGSWGEL